MKGSVRDFIRKTKLKEGRFLPPLTLLLILLLGVSLLVPKSVIDTYKTNVTEEEGDEEYVLWLREGERIVYSMNTGSRPIMGIHVALSKNGGEFRQGNLVCDVASDASGKTVSRNLYSLNQGEDLQYIYIPFENYEACIGDIRIQFSYDPSGNEAGEYPGLLANGRQTPGASTEINGSTIEGNLKTIYIYTHDTYPLVYDLRILICVFLAACMTLNARQKKGRASSPLSQMFSRKNLSTRRKRG